MDLTGAQALVRSLEEQGVEVVFGLPGGTILPTYDPLLSSSLRHVLVRHEQGAGHAAEGYAWATGRPGVCMATSGPGATNLVTALADAYMDSVPMVAITGQVGDRHDRHRRLPGSRHHRHHAADHQAQRARDRPGADPGGDRRGVPHRHHRAARPGADRRAQGRPAGHRARGRWPPQLDLPGYRVPGPPSAGAIAAAAALLRAGPPPGALRRRRRDQVQRARGAVPRWPSWPGRRSPPR